MVALLRYVGCLLPPVGYLRMSPGRKFLLSFGVLDPLGKLDLVSGQGS